MGCLRLFISILGEQCIPFYTRSPSFRTIQQDNDPKRTNSQIDRVSPVEVQTECKNQEVQMFCSTEDTKCLLSEISASHQLQKTAKSK